MCSLAKIMAVASERDSSGGQRFRAPYSYAVDALAVSIFYRYSTNQTIKELFEYLFTASIRK